MRIKDDSVRFVGICPQIVLALMVANDAFKEFGQEDLVITSVNDAKHSYTSLHYDGRAVDIRTKNIPRDFVRQLVLHIGECLGTDFDVLLEDYGGSNEHCHIEWQPRGPK